MGSLPRKTEAGMRKAAFSRQLMTVLKVYDDIVKSIFGLKFGVYTTRILVRRGRLVSTALRGNLIPVACLRYSHFDGIQVLDRDGASTHTNTPNKCALFSYTDAVANVFHVICLCDRPADHEVSLLRVVS